jgi:hypothetical protein
MRRIDFAGNRTHHRAGMTAKIFQKKGTSFAVPLTKKAQAYSYPENSSARISSSAIPEPMSMLRTPVTIPGGPAM